MGQLKGERVVNVCEMVGEPMAGLVSGGISESRVLCDFFWYIDFNCHILPPPYIALQMLFAQLPQRDRARTSRMEQNRPPKMPKPFKVAFAKYG